MTPPPEVVQWLISHNMRAISTEDYVKLKSENFGLKKRIERYEKRYEAVLAK
ncbi:hypothetical protein AAC03nite_20450 [Alicyclobacillus acidoterrestris]|nr:hypothetical protein AAC03nite_20450 [Alicyclobacillus acidoterrestris]